MGPSCAQHGVLEARELLTVKTTLIAARNLNRILENHIEKIPILNELGQEMIPASRHYRGHLKDHH